MPSPLILIASFLASVVFTGAYRRIALRANFVDLPVSRSAHSSPVPVGGGVVIFLLFLITIMFLFAGGKLSVGQFMALSASSAIAIVGFVDDIKELKIKWRIYPQLFASIWAVWWIGGIPEVNFYTWTVSQQWLLNFLGVIGIVWLVNLYNFMDGIDGLAASELSFVNLMSLLFVINNSDSAFSILSLVSLGSALGFLVWNWSPAKVFMGDVGSGFIGFMLGVIAIISIQQQTMTVWTWLILLAVFVVDATLTLLKRFAARQKWYQGHASHAYQKAAKRFNSHRKVTIAIMLINIFWLAPLASLSVLYPKLGIALTAAAIVPLILLATRLQAGKEDKAITGAGHGSK
jgi:Fuc2NAc and GlcNAc transferase